MLECGRRCDGYALLSGQSIAYGCIGGKRRGTWIERAGARSSLGVSR